MMKKTVLRAKHMVRDLLRSRDGNFAFLTAILLLPLLLAVGCAVDVGYAVMAKTKLQIECDAAMLMTVQKLKSMTSSELRDLFIKTLKAQNKEADFTYVISLDDVAVDATGNNIKAVVKARVPTFFMRLINMNYMEVAAEAAAVGPKSSYVDVAIVLDKSASMMLAATPADQTKLQSKTGCAFACHNGEGYSYTYNGTTYWNVYNVAKAMGITFRADVSVAAAKQVVNMIAALDPTHSRVRIGFYTIGSVTTQALAPTYSTDTALAALSNDATKLTSATSEITTRFDLTLPTLAKFIGKAGDGTTAASPMKVVLILTDGVESDRTWVTQDQANTYKVAPLNPGWCGTMKANLVTVGVLYTEYLRVTGNWGYDYTLGSSMDSAKWASTWGGTLRPNLSSTIGRRDYIPYALQDCATSPGLFRSANSPQDIQDGLSALFRTYIEMTRMTM